MIYQQIKQWKIRLAENENNEKIEVKTNLEISLFETIIKKIKSLNKHAIISVIS
jgi:hypothetical protein